MGSCTYLDTVYDTAYDLIVEKALYSKRLSYSDSIIFHEGNNLEISDMHYIVYAYYFYSCYFITIIALLYSIIDYREPVRCVQDVGTLIRTIVMILILFTCSSSFATNLIKDYNGQIQ